jgi:hypothetical protein
MMLTQRKAVVMVMVTALMLLLPVTRLGAHVCSATGYSGLTAALVNPGSVSGGMIDAGGCDIGIYYSGQSAKVRNVIVTGALYYGIFVNGDNAATSVDILDSAISYIGDSPFNGNQRGVAVYYRAYLATGSATGRVSGNHIDHYQKGGIVVNGTGSNVQVQDNVVEGFGPVGFIAQNGIQFGYGSSGSAMKNTVSGHSYTGTSTVSGGIIVVGGPGYGVCPDGNPCLYTSNIQIVGNTVVNNDVGIFLTNLAADFSAPDEATNVKAVNNTITSDALTNNYGGFGYQAGVSDVGNNDKIIANRISGAGYGPTAGYTVAIDADASLTNRPKVHANK